MSSKSIISMNCSQNDLNKSTTTTTKAHLKAELVFAYEIKKCSAQKVVCWMVFVSPNFEKYGREMEKTKIAFKIMASSRISPTT